MGVLRVGYVWVLPLCCKGGTRIVGTHVEPHSASPARASVSLLLSRGHPSSYPGTDFIMGCLRPWAMVCWEQARTGPHHSGDRCPGLASLGWGPRGLGSFRSGIHWVGVHMEQSPSVLTSTELGSMRTGELLIWNSLGWGLYGPGSVWSDIHWVVVHAAWGPRGLISLGWHPHGPGSTQIGIIGIEFLRCPSVPHQTTIHADRDPTFVAPTWTSTHGANPH